MSSGIPAGTIALSDERLRHLSTIYAITPESLGWLAEWGRRHPDLPAWLAERYRVCLLYTSPSPRD